MNGNRFLLDSNICIYLSKEELRAPSIIRPGDFVAISLITYMEALGHNFADPVEEKYLLDFFKKIAVLPIEDSIATLVISYRKLRKIKLPDAILLATARINNCTLVTRNTEDFRNLDDQVEIFNPFEK